jgi:hypothetical protein
MNSLVYGKTAVDPELYNVIPVNIPEEDQEPAIVGKNNLHISETKYNIHPTEKNRTVPYFKVKKSKKLKLKKTIFTI